MQTKLISINPHKSNIRLFCILLISFAALGLSIYFNIYLGLIFVIAYCLAFSTRPKYNLHIDTAKNKFTLIKNQYEYNAELIGCRQVTFLVTIITLKYNRSTINLPIFIDSTSISQYKNLRMFLQWN